MAGIGFNIAKGREVEFYQRVLDDDPIDSALIMLILATGTTIEALRDFDTVAAMLASTPNEVTNAGYARATFIDSDLDPWFPDDTNNQTLLTLPLHTFGTPNIAAGSVWDIAVVAYGPDGSFGTDADLIPITATELRIDGTAVPGIGEPIIVDFSSGWVVAT